MLSNITYNYLLTARRAVIVSNPYHEKMKNVYFQTHWSLT